MKTYRYSLKTKNGEASGTVEAANEKDVEQLLRKAYVMEYRDDKGKKQQNDIVELDLQEVEQP